MAHGSVGLRRANRGPYPDRCPDGAISHGPPDGAGRCPWCRQLVTYPVPAPRSYPRSDLSEEYGYHYDPDEGTRGKAERARELQSGVAYY